MWPLPIFHEPKGSGEYHARIPEFEMNDLQRTNDVHVEQTMEISESRESVMQYSQYSIYKYKGASLRVFDKVHSIPENHPKIPNSKFIENYDDLSD